MATSDQILQACKALQSHGVIAYPTESVFGLGCDPDNAESVKRILALKNRPAEKGLILIASSFVQLEKYLLPVPADVQQRVFASWPGPFTWLWPVRDEVSELIRGQHATIAVRVSAHPVVKQLCESFGKAIISTSANPAEKAPAKNATEVRNYFDDRLDYILDADVGSSSQPTEIRDALSNELVRAG